MVKRLLRAGGSGVGLLLCVLLGAAAGLRAQAVSAVPKLDLHRSTGTWYEMARLPNKREKRCVGDGFMLIADGEKPDRLLVVVSCKAKSGYPNVFNVQARAQDKSGDGKLKVRYIWPFYKKFWVLDVGPEYEWALVGSPNHKSLWVLSRTPVMTPEVLREVEARAAAEGFPMAKVVAVPQSGR